MAILINLLLCLDVFVGLLMILLILMQRPKSEGLGAAFGGGVTENIFGAQTTNVLTRITGWLAGLFFAFTFLLSVLYAHQSRGGSSSGLHRELEKSQPLPAASVAPAAVPVASAAPSAGAAAIPAGSAPPEAPLAPAASPKPEDLAVGAVVPNGNAPVSPAPAVRSPEPSPRP